MKESISRRSSSSRALSCLLSFTLSIAFLFGLSLLSSCQKVDLGDEGSVQQVKGKTRITFNIRQFEQIPFSSTASRSQDITTLCDHIVLAVYKGGERVENVSQKAEDNDFGQLSLSLSPGTYKVVILAHSQSRNPTTTKVEKVSFNGDVTDTFYWSGQLTVEEGKGQDIDVDMHRAVAMVRFITTDNVPAGVSSIKFYYTGGSSSINGLTGKGCVNSKQTAIRQISSDMTGKPATFAIYTIPKDDASRLKIKVTAMDANGATVMEREFSDVPVARNQITEYTGSFFESGGGTSVSDDSSAKFSLTTDDQWTTVQRTY